MRCAVGKHGSTKRTARRRRRPQGSGLPASLNHPVSRVNSLAVYCTRNPRPRPLASGKLAGAAGWVSPSSDYPHTEGPTTWHVPK